jgi:hypothetical protein
MGQAADPFANASDEAILGRAACTLRRAAALEPGSVHRAIEWAKFDACMMELDRRAAAYVLARIREQDGGQG